MQHQRHLASPRVAGGRPRLAIEGDFSSDVIDALTQQVRQYVRADVSGHFVGFWTASRSHPDRQLSLNRARENLH